MKAVRKLEEDLQVRWVSVCHKETESMAADSSSAKKGKGDNEPSSSSKKKTESSSLGSGSASGSGDTSSLRRSTRETPSSKKQGDNASPVTVRKSLRLENRAAAPATPMAKKTSEKPSPLRRSGRENKFQSPSSRTPEKGTASKGGLKQQKASKSPVLKENGKGKTCKEVAEESNGKQNRNVGSKRKTRLSARLYKDMFTPVTKKSKLSDLANKRTLENCDVDGGDRESEINEEGEEDNGEGDDLKDNGSKNIDVGAAGSNLESEKEVCNKEQCDGEAVENSKPSVSVDSDGEELRDNGNRNLHFDTGVLDDSKKEVHDDKHCEPVQNLQPCMTADIPTSSCVAEARKIEAKDIGVDCSTIRKPDSQDHLSSNELSNDSNSSRYNSEVSRSKGAQPCCKDTGPSISSSSKLVSLSEKCSKCNRKQRLEYNSLERELCCCLTNSVDDVDVASGSKDRGESGSHHITQCAEKPGQNSGHSQPLVNGEQGTCFTCKSSGTLLHCIGKGCARSYHAFCLWTSDENKFLPMWYCSECTKKRLTLGVHSVSEGIESIWDVREVESSNSTGVEKQKQYFVKYKGLAHIHNLWVSEVRLRHEVPDLLVKFHEKKEGIQWNPEWVVPHRLLKRRLLIADDSDKLNDSVAGTVSNGQSEWLVKWRGLDYDLATWEFEDSSCFKEPDMQRLIREYETRHEMAKTRLWRNNEIQERRKASHVKGGRPNGSAALGADSCYTNSVNRLRDYYHRKQNAVLLDEQDRIVKVVYLVSSMLTNLCRPILIISPSAVLSFWEAEFFRLAPSVNLVVYGGSMDARNVIRSLEFYEGGSIMFQVLLSSAEVVAEDLQAVKAIQWEAVIVDDCQHSCVMAHIGSIKNLITNWRLLLINTHLQDVVADYASILSLLESGDSSDQNYGQMVDSIENINVLKERLSSFVCCARFLEYWVPVQISDLQLEQYCSLILANQTALLSCSKSDPVGSLCDILISTRKCCDHPYIVDRFLQRSLLDGLTESSTAAVLDLGTKGSGKLALLAEVLSELRHQQLKVLILFQSIGGAAKDSIGDILDDFLSMRFGSDSYERVDSGCLSAKKQAALNKFNKEKQRSFFLLETRACLPSIKLSSVDAVILFGSDWNPLNDLRALQKMTIESKLEQIKVFRLYSSCTVEEKLLILAKNGMIIDNPSQGISPSISQKLLMWGASHLFTRLDEFHCGKVANSLDSSVPGDSFFKYVCEEIMSAVQNDEIVKSIKYVSLARQNGGGYLKNIALVGEQKVQLVDGVPPHLFWMKLLEGKHPQWRYLSGSSQRTRKRVHYQQLEDQGDEGTKKSRKAEKAKADGSLQQAAAGTDKSNVGKKGLKETFETTMTNNLESGAKTHLPSHNNGNAILPAVVNDNPGAHVNLVESDYRINLYNEQLDLFGMLWPTMSTLCETLQVKDEGRDLAEQFLQYVLKHHRFMAEREAILHAFQISMCWTAAEALHQKIDHKWSLDVAREKLNINCREEEAETIYLKIKMLMKIFLRRPEGFKTANSSNSNVSATNADTVGSQERGMELGFSSVVDGFDEKILSLLQKVKKKCDKHLEKIKEKQGKELEEFEKKCEAERAELEKKYKMESAIICSIHGRSAVGVGRLKILDKNCAKEREDLEHQISMRRKELEARQQAEREAEQKKTAKWLEQVNSLAKSELMNNPPSDNGLQLQAAEHIDGRHSNGSPQMVDKYLPKINFDKETSGTPMVKTTPICSEGAKFQENTENPEESCLVTDLQRVYHHHGASIINCLKDDGLNHMVKEVSCHVDLLNRQAVPDAETVLDSCGQGSPLKQPGFAATLEVEENSSRIKPHQVDQLAVLETNLVNQASILLQKESLPSSGVSVRKHSCADLASEAPSMSQEIEDESCQSLAGGAHEQVQNVTDMQNSLAHGETSLASSNAMQTNLMTNAKMGSLSAATTENSFPESATPQAPDSSIINNPCRQVLASVEGTVALLQLDGDVANSGEMATRPMPELAVDDGVNGNLGQFQTYTSTSRGTLPALASHPNPQVPIFAVSRSTDPLQNELERIRKEIDEVVNIHEDTKMRLKSECEKEIEEIVAQIRKKYDEKLEEAQASFSLKKNELELNQNKVMMHKILAEAFRSKCMDYKAASGMQQAIPSGSVEHVSQMRTTAARPPSTAGSCSAIPPIVSTHNAARPGLALHPSLALASHPIARSPRINPLPMAPRRQPFRSESLPLSTSCTPPLPRGISVQQQPLPSNPLTSSSAPQFSPRPPQSQAQAMQPTVVNSHDQSLQTRMAGSTEALMENRMHNNENVHCLVNSSSSVPDNVPNSAAQEVPQFETIPMMLMASSSLGAGNDVVCLSDDE